MQEIGINSTKRSELIDITPEIEKLLKERKAKEGICLVYCPHTTAAVTVNEVADSSVKQDILSALSRLVPENASYVHAEGNSDAHIKSAIVGNSRAVPFENSMLSLGQWEGIYFCEFDGPRNRRILVQFIEK